MLATSLWSPEPARLDDEAVDHVFLVEQWHCYNNALPFFRALPRARKYLFSDVGQPEPGFWPLAALRDFRPARRCAVVYVTLGSQVAWFRLRERYPHIRLVRIYHGVVMPWAQILKQHDSLDVALTIGELDSSVWREHRPDQRIIAVGWPYGEAFLAVWRPQPADAHALAINSSWARARSAFEICDRLGELGEYRIAFLLHALLQIDRPNPRRVDPTYVRQQLEKLPPNVRLVTCEAGALPHLRDAGLLLGMLSSSSVEWLIFNRPILMIKKSSHIPFGPVIDNRVSLRQQVVAARDHERSEYRERRNEWRVKLVSHLDGRWAERFRAIAEEMETAVLNETAATAKL